MHRDFGVIVWSEQLAAFEGDGGTIEYRVDHPRWTVWPASESEVDCDFGAIRADPISGQ